MSHPRRNILIVESDTAEANKVENFLKESSIECTVNQVRGLESAVEYLAQEKCDLILLNLMLQDSGGVYTLSRLNQKIKEIPVIVVNGPDDDAMMEKSLHAGAQEYLKRKEIGTNSLARALASTFARTSPEKPEEEDKDKKQHASKLAALSSLADNVVKGMNPSINELGSFIEQLKNGAARGEDPTQVVQNLLDSAYEAFEELRKNIVNLQLYSQDLQKDPLVKDQAKRQYRFLVVEDEPEVAELIVGRLHKMGHELVQTAENGLEGYNVCVRGITKNRRIDAVISDWNMPKMNGLQLLEKLRDNVFYEKVPFLMLTALDQKTNVQLALEHGVSQYLMKPFRNQELEQKVTNLVHAVHG